jgi:3-dehydroquinate synthase
MASASISVGQGERAYAVEVGPGLLHEVGGRLRALGKHGRVALITDASVERLWLAPVRASLTAAGIDSQTLVVPPGEASKSLATADSLYTQLIQGGFTRSDTVVALGGGVVGDLAGFVAATYHRGMGLVHLPTTLLAQVDSSIGGKVAVDHALGKNLVGAFYPPRAVLTDTRTLASLPKRERWSGLAEVAKAALIADAELLQWLERDLEALGDGTADEATTARAIERSVSIKAHVVTADEKEQGLRMVLNFGHTLGHALESETGYGPLLHGEAVVMGMRVALGVSRTLGKLSVDDEARARALLARFPAPPPFPKPTREGVLAALRRDKKSHAAKVRFVVLTGLGRSDTEPLDPAALEPAVEEALEALP